MEFNQIKETSLYVEELDRTETFYHGKLGMKVISKVAGRHIFFRAGSSVLLCFIAETTRQSKNGVGHFGRGNMHIAFEVPGEKYDEVKEQVLSSDIEIVFEQEWSGEYRSFYFRDPDGHLLEVVPAGMWD